MKHFLHFVDFVCKWGARVVLGFPLAMMFIGVYEVVSRDIFNNPTKWAWPINAQLLGVYIGLAGAYVLLIDGHVRMDLFYDRLSARTKAIVNSVLSVIFFLYVGGLLYYLSEIAVTSVVMRETDKASTLNPPIYQTRVLVAVSALLLLLAGISSFIRNMKTAIKGPEGAS